MGRSHRTQGERLSRGHQTLRKTRLRRSQQHARRRTRPARTPKTKHGTTKRNGKTRETPREPKTKALVRGHGQGIRLRIVMAPSRLTTVRRQVTRTNVSGTKTCMQGVTLGKCVLRVSLTPMGRLVSLRQHYSGGLGRITVRTRACNICPRRVSKLGQSCRGL